MRTTILAIVLILAVGALMLNLGLRLIDRACDGLDKSYRYTPEDPDSDSVHRFLKKENYNLHYRPNRSAMQRNFRVQR